MTAARFSTLGLADGERAGAWESWNRRALVGVRCRTPDGHGLRADQLNLHLPTGDPDGAVGLARVRAARHEVVRDEQLVGAAPTDAAVVYAVLRGRTVFTGPGGSVPLAAGQALVVDGDRPFRRTFPTAFAEVVVTVPRALWAARLDLAGRPSAGPVVLAGAAAARAGALARHLAGPAGSGPDDPDGTAARVVALDLLADVAGGAGTGDRLALARMLVGQLLHDPALGERGLAARLGMSTRHLSRLFAESGTSVPAFVTARRLARARDLLRTTDRPVAGVAAACGFASASYFTRVFAREVGETPARFRAAGAACTFRPSGDAAPTPV